jgi:hypothetical protein
MEHDSPKGRPRPPKAEPMAAPSEAELSRMAREAVRQPADPRLDKQLAWMGLLDTDEPPEPGAAEPHAAEPHAAGPRAAAARAAQARAAEARAAASQAPDPRPAQASGGPVVSASELEHIRADLRRVEATLWVVIAAIGLLAVTVLVLLLR